MDILVLGYYATICAGLSFAAPLMPNAGARLAVGAAVGIVAAALLPLVRGWIG